MGFFLDIDLLFNPELGSLCMTCNISLTSPVSILFPAGGQLDKDKQRWKLSPLLAEAATALGIFT